MTEAVSTMVDTTDHENVWESVLAENGSPTREPVESSSWQPVDLTTVLDGTYTPPAPTVGERDDGVGLWYPGRQHAVIGETESLKSWLAQLGAVTELKRGNGVLYIDFEDDAHSVVGRMLALQVNAAVIRDHFAYLRPEGPVTDARNFNALKTAMNDLQPTLCILDGITEAMTMHGLNPLDNRDAAQFGRELPRKITDTGTAVVSLDHVTKDREGRGRYAIGAAHKLNGLNGAAYSLENRTPLSVGTTGRSTLLILKDRPGQIREHAVRATGGNYWFADLTIKSHTIDFVEANLEPPGDAPQRFRPTSLMHQVSAALAAAPEPLNQRGILDRVQSKAENVRAAIACLIDEGNITTSPGPNRATMHTLTKPFKED